MTRRKIRTTILSLVTALVIAAVAAPLASAAVVPSGSVLGNTLTTSDGYTPETQICCMDTPSFTVFSNTTTTSSVYVQGLIVTNPYGVQAVQALLNEGYRIQIRVWGDDPVYDDLLVGPVTPEMYPGVNGPDATYGGLGFRADIPVSNSVLDEDDSIFDERDEVYASIRLLDPNGKTIKSGETKRITRYW
jgi:hypothetical protein